MTVDFTFTEAFFPDSSWVDGAYYNGNENYVVFDLNDEYYKYYNVTRDEVVKLDEATSPGAYYNSVWKASHSAAQRLGDNPFFHQVDKKTASGLVQNQWTDTTNSANHRGARTENTREISLVTPDAATTAAVAELKDYQVTFVLNGVEKTSNVKANFLREALDDFEDRLELFDVDAEVIEVALLGDW